MSDEPNTEELLPAEIDGAATYMHANGATGLVEAWARDPDDRLKVRIKDAWLFFDELTRADHAEADDPDELDA